MHKIWDILRLGVNGLLVHKFRSVLAAMGIIFGVCSVIAMLAIGQGAEKTSREYLRELGSNNIIINAVKPSGDQSSASSSDEGAMLTYGLTHADAERLRDPANMPGIRIGVAVHRAARTAYADGRQIKTDVIATSPDYLQVANIKLTRGRFIEPADLIRRKSYCVITETLARKLYDYRDPIGRIVDFNSEPFLVVGVLQALPKALAQQAGDAAAIIPLTTDVARFGEMLVMSEEGSRTIEQVDVSQLVLQMEDEQAVLRGAEIARSLLTRYHEKKDWHVQVPLELIEQQAKQQRLWTMVLMVVGAVSLVVGGIGIMNIMLASVTERTREIGIRRALGAKKRDITIQFLIEAVALTAVGGLVGIIIGWFVPSQVESLLGFKTDVTAVTLLLPLVMAVLCGVVSGLYPAIRAAALDPIVALRHE